MLKTQIEKVSESKENSTKKKVKFTKTHQKGRTFLKTKQKI